MGASREGFDLLTKQGRANFICHIRRRRFPSYVWGDTFMQIWCWIVGHNSYDSNAGGYPPEPACKRCHKYL